MESNPKYKLHGERKFIFHFNAKWGDRHTWFLLEYTKVYRPNMTLHSRTAVSLVCNLGALFFKQNIKTENSFSLLLKIGEVLCHLQQPWPFPLQVSSQQPLAHWWCHLLDLEHAQVSQQRMINNLYCTQWGLTNLKRPFHFDEFPPSACATVWRYQQKCEWRGGRSASGSCSQTLEDEMISDSSWRRNSAVRWRFIFN